MKLFKIGAILLSLCGIALVDVISGWMMPYTRPSLPKKNDSFVISSPTRGHQFIPNASFVYDGVSYKTNDLGFRDRAYSLQKPKGTLRIAVLGDSFIEGMGEAQEDTIPKVLERRLKAVLNRPVEVMNCGIRAGCPALYQFWVQDLLPYSLDAVVICVFDNDMDDDACQLLKNTFVRAGAWHELPLWARRSNLMARASIYAAYVVSKIQRKTVSKQIFGEEEFRRENKRKDGDENAIGSNAVGYTVYPEKWQEHWARTRGFLDRTIHHLRSNQIPTLVVHIPSNNMFPPQPKKANTSDLWQSGSGFQKDHFSFWVAQWAGERGLPMVNLFERFVDWYTDPKNPPLYQTTYYHFNKHGLEKAAEWIEPHLKALLKE